MSRREREALIDEVEKFLVDSAYDLPPMKEHAKEPVCIKERVRVRNGVAAKCVDGFREQPANGKVSKNRSRSEPEADNRKKRNGNLKTSKERDSAKAPSTSKGFKTWLVSSLLCKQPCQQQQNSNNTISSGSAKDAVSKHTNDLQANEYPTANEQPGDSGRFHSIQGSETDSRSSSAARLQQNSYKDGSISRTQQSGKASAANESPSATASKEPKDSKSGKQTKTTIRSPKQHTNDESPTSSREAVNEPICVKQHYIRRYTFKAHGGFTINARPFRQPRQDPDASQPPDSNIQPHIDGSGNPRNIHQYVNYDNCTEDVTEVGHDRQ